VASITCPVSSSEGSNLPCNYHALTGTGSPADSFPLCCSDPYHSLECLGGSASGCQPLYCSLLPPPPAPPPPLPRSSPFTDKGKYDYYDFSE
jgi:hypothetical protein